MLLHARHRMACALAALEVKVFNIESTLETYGTQLGDVCFMSEYNAKVQSMLCERVGWGLEHVQQLPVQRQGMRAHVGAEPRADVV